MRRIVCRQQQRGAATLVVAMVLMFAMSLAAYFLNRNMATEHRLAANQVLAAQAFEAAEAGLEWATAQLNNAKKSGTDCLPSTEAAAQSFRTRYLNFDASTGLHTPRTWTQAAKAMSLQAVCVRNPGQANGWACSCPASGHPSLPVNNTTPAFVVTLMPASTPGQLRVVAQGCTSHAGACQPGSNSKADATAQVQQLVALVGGLASAPVAVLTAVGNVNTPSALGLHLGNVPSMRATVQAGGHVLAPNARIGAAAGGVSSLSVVEHDKGLTSLSAARFFSLLFGADAATWRAQNVVHKLACADNCNAAVLDALATTDGPLLMWAEGDLTLTGPLNVGTATRPVLLVVSGSAKLSGEVQVHGLLHAARVEWNADGTGAGRVTGAVTSASDYKGSGAPDLVFDAAVLQTLQANSGSFARVAGSWKDF